MATKKIMVVPCIVNIRLKTCGETKSLCGPMSWIRMMVASTPADHQKHQRIKDVQDAQPFVIDGGDPFVKPAHKRGRRSDLRSARASTSVMDIRSIHQRSVSRYAVTALTS